MLRQQARARPKQARPGQAPNKPESRPKQARPGHIRPGQAHDRPPRGGVPLFFKFSNVFGLFRLLIFSPLTGQCGITAFYKRPVRPCLTLMHSVVKVHIRQVQL